MAGAEPLKVFFFGGADGVAARASERINADIKGVRCVGFESPGFGSVEAMSSDDLIGRINASEADFVMVSIGVAKGQAWIERNRRRLTVPSISYLGAVLNFVAGTVRRAPRWVQRAGFEWLWRIKEEPALWQRYARDGSAYVALLFSRILPYRWHSTAGRPSEAELNSAATEYLEDERGAWLVLRGAWSERCVDALHPLLDRAMDAAMPLRLDLTQCNYADSHVIALLLILWAHRHDSAWPCQVTASHPRLLRMLRACCAEYLLDTPGDAAIQPRA